MVIGSSDADGYYGIGGFKLKVWEKSAVYCIEFCVDTKSAISRSASGGAGAGVWQAGVAVG